MSPPPPDPGSGTIDITPDDVAAAAKTFATAQNDLYNAWSTLQTSLDQNAGMAGNDSVARKFNDQYDKGVKAAWKVLHQGIITFGGISTGLTTTANNFVKADHHSSGHAGAPPLYAPEPIFEDVVMADVDSALGPGQGGLPGPLAKFWPNADTGKVRAAARAWHTAADAIDGINGRANTAIAGLTASPDDDNGKAINEFWNDVYNRDDPKTVLAGMYHICKALGDACDKYAKSVDDAHDKMKNALIGAGIAVGLTTLAGAALSIFTLGGSDAAAGAADAAEAEAILGPIAAETAATVGTEVAAAVSDDLVAAVETAADEAPTVEAVEADTTQIEEALESEMAQTEGKSLGDLGSIDETSGSWRESFDRLPKGRQGHVRTVGSEDELRRLFSQWVQGAERLPARGPKIPEVYRLSDGTIIQWRVASRSGGATIDIFPPNSGGLKVHVG